MYVSSVITNVTRPVTSAGPTNSSYGSCAPLAVKIASAFRAMCSSPSSHNAVATPPTVVTNVQFGVGASVVKLGVGTDGVDGDNANAFPEYSSRPSALNVKPSSDHCTPANCFTPAE